MIPIEIFKGSRFEYRPSPSLDERLLPVATRVSPHDTRVVIASYRNAANVREGAGKQPSGPKFAPPLPLRHLSLTLSSFPSSLCWAAREMSRVFLCERMAPHAGTRYSNVSCAVPRASKRPPVPSQARTRGKIDGERPSGGLPSIASRHANLTHRHAQGGDGWTRGPRRFFRWSVARGIRWASLQAE